MVYDNVPPPPDMPEGWSVRFIAPGDEEGVLRVLSEAFPRWPKLDCSVAPIEHLRWKLASHPAAAKIHVVVESPDGIVGARLDWAQETMLGDRVYTVRQSIDRGVRPEFRLNGAMAAMRNYKQELHDASFDMYMGYSTDAPGMENLQRYSARATRFRRVIDVLECNVESATPRIDSSLNVHAVEAFDARGDALWSDARAQFRYGVVRSSAYLNWRYADRCAGDYTILACEQDACWLGYVVVRCANDVAYIADLLALLERPDVADALLAAAIDHVRANGPQRIECWSDAHSVYRWSLDKVGFRDLRRSITLSFRPLSFPPEDAAFLDDPTASVLFSAGDTDLV